MLSLSTGALLLEPSGCGVVESPCKPHSTCTVKTVIFYLSVYLIALGYGGYQPNIATFGSDQFDADDSVEGHSKIAFFSYFYLALNLGSLLSNTVLGYFEDQGAWPLGFWASAGSAFAGLVLFLAGTPKYRHFKPRESPWSRFCQVLVASTRKAKIDVNYEDMNLYDSETQRTGDKKILHTKGFR